MMDKEQFAEIDENDPRVTEMFRKRFLITQGESYSLPLPTSMFQTHPWQIAELQSLKQQLNNVKDRLNDYDVNEWWAHTTRRNKAADVQRRVRKEIGAEFVTQAWCKFYEILSFFDVIPVDRILASDLQFTSVHLCEAPGAFVTSLNHWLKTNTTFDWNWVATTLNPYYEGNSLSRMINDDRFMTHTLDHWCFGADSTGNLMDLQNLDKLVEVAKANDNILLVTADGSIDCVDVPGEQESIVAHLQYCETVAALHLLNAGGSFVIKIFTIFEHRTVCLIYLLCCCFNKVVITKPATSKEGNSECYLVCINFKGSKYIKPYLNILRDHYGKDPHTAMFHKTDISLTFIDKIIRCSTFFKSLQAQVILSNIITFNFNEMDDNDAMKEVKRIQEVVSKKYIKDCGLVRLPPGSEIVSGSEIKRVTHSKMSLCESFNKRRKKETMSPEQRLWLHYDNLQEIFKNITKFKPVKFYSGEEHIHFNISEGKSFYRIYSSKFCEENILKIQIAVTDLLEKMHLQIQFPSKEDVRYLIEKSKEKNYKVLCFQYTDLYYSYRIIFELYALLQILSFGDNVVLIGYSLLTHLNVGLLYLLKLTFNSYKMIYNNVAGCLIILKDYKKDTKILKMWEMIRYYSHQAHKKNKAILSLLPVQYLYDWNAYPRIMEYNHWNIKTYIDYVIHNIKNN